MKYPRKHWYPGVIQTGPCSYRLTEDFKPMEPIEITPEMDEWHKFDAIEMHNEAAKRSKIGRSKVSTEAVESIRMENDYLSTSIADSIRQLMLYENKILQTYFDLYGSGYGCVVRYVHQDGSEQMVDENRMVTIYTKKANPTMETKGDSCVFTYSYNVLKEVADKLDEGEENEDM